MESLRVSRMLQDALAAWGRRFGFFTAVLVFTSLPELAVELLAPRPHVLGELDRFTALALFFQLLGDSLGSGILTFAIVSELRGGDSRASTALAQGLRNWPALVGLSIAGLVGVLGGLVVLIVPGLVLLCMWFVAIPALLFEPDGIFGALGRSATLTKGVRWKILGFYALLLLVQLLGFMVVRCTPLHEHWGGKLLDWVVSDVNSLLSTLAAAQFYDRRVRNEATASLAQPAS